MELGIHTAFGATDQALSIGTVVLGDVTVKSVFRPILLLGVTLSVAFGAVHAAKDRDALVAAGHHLVISTQSDTHHTVLVDGTPVFKDPNDEFLKLNGPFSCDGKTYVLLAEQPGGNACDIVYQAVDITTLPVKISRVFGNCAAAEASVKKETLSVVTGSYGGLYSAGSPNIAKEAVTYIDGRLCHLH